MHCSFTVFCTLVDSPDKITALPPNLEFYWYIFLEQSVSFQIFIASHLMLCYCSCTLLGRMWKQFVSLCSRVWPSRLLVDLKRQRGRKTQKIYCWHCWREGCFAEPVYCNNKVFTYRPLLYSQCTGDRLKATLLNRRISVSFYVVSCCKSGWRKGVHL